METLRRKRYTKRKIGQCELIEVPLKRKATAGEAKGRKIKDNNERKMTGISAT